MIRYVDKSEFAEARMKYKKERGQFRKMRRLLINIEKIIPYENTERSYEHFHVPSDPFISSPKTSGKIKTTFCKAWLKKTVEIMEQKPESLPFCKVVSCIVENDLWSSQIIIFYDEEYYNNFWKRDTSDQTWVPISTPKSFASERKIITSLNEKGYFEKINDGETLSTSVIWFYGDI